MNKVTDSRHALYVKTIGDSEKIISVTDAILMQESGVELRDHLFDIKTKEKLKFVYTDKKSSYFATKAETTAKLGQRCSNIASVMTELHSKATKFFKSNKYKGLNFGFFRFPTSSIISVELEKEYQYNSLDGVVVLRPDVTITTDFMVFFVEITVTNPLSSEKIEKYKSLYRSKVIDTPFSVVEIDLSSFVDLLNIYSWEVVKEVVYTELVYNSEYKKFYPMISLSLRDKPFGVSLHSGLPFKLGINPIVDGYNKDLKTLITDKDCLEVIRCTSDELHSLYLTTDAAESPLYPLDFFQIPHSIDLG